MACDEEKADIEVNDHVSQNSDSPVGHPGVSTSPEDDEKERPDDDKSIHSTHSHVSSDFIEAIAGIQESVQRSSSTPASVRSRPLSIVARNKRRGLLARFALIPEVNRPYDYPRRTKWLITLIVALAGAAAPIGSAIFLRECSAFQI